MTENSNIYVTNIENETKQNSFFRKVLFTSCNQQLVVMSIKPNKDVPLEIHPTVDQFIRIEEGNCKIFTGKEQKYEHELTENMVAIVPANTWHRIVNTSKDKYLKLYTLYSPPNHPRGEIDVDNPEQTGGIYLMRNDKNRKNIIFELKKMNYIY